MPRYAAFLRGVMPMNAKMPELRRAFEEAGFDEVRTVLGSGNVVFGARAGVELTLQRQAEQAMEKYLGRTFMTIVRSVDGAADAARRRPVRLLPAVPRSPSAS